MIANHNLEPQGDQALTEVRESLRALCDLLKNRGSLDALSTQPRLVDLINRLHDYALYGDKVHADGEYLSSRTFVSTPDSILKRVSVLQEYLDDADAFNNLARIVRGNGWRETIEGVQNLSDLLKPKTREITETFIPTSPSDSTDDDLIISDFIVDATNIQAPEADPRISETIITPTEKASAAITVDGMPLRRLEDSIRLVPDGVIGRGGMGMVVKAYDDNIGGNLVALKICTSNDPHQHARFSSEIKISGSLLGVNQAVGATGAYYTSEAHQIEYQGTLVTIPKGSRCFTTPYITQVSTLEDMLRFYHALCSGKSLKELTAPPDTLKVFLSDNHRTLDGSKIDQSFATLTDDQQREKKSAIVKQFVDFERTTLFPVEYFDLRGADLSFKEVRERVTTRLIETLTNAARVVHELHARGIVHRDIKPGNILVSPTGVPYIIDFGLARKLQSQESNEWGSDDDFTLEIDTQLTQPGKLLGTPSCMAPEQIIGDPTLVSKALDTYAFGSMLYYLYSGRTQLGELDGTQNGFLNALTNVRDGKVKDPNRFGSSQSTGLLSSLSQIISDPSGWGLQEIIKHAMRKEPSERHKSVIDLVHELDDWRNGLQVSSVKTSPDLTTAEKKLYQTACTVRANSGKIAAGIITFGVFAGLVKLEHSAITDRADALELAETGQRTARALDPDLIQSGIERTIEAQGKLAALRFDPFPHIWSAFSGEKTSSAIVDATRQHLETRANLHRDFLLPAYDAIAGASNDSGTSRTRTDKGRENLRAILDKHIHGHDQPGAAVAHLDHLKSLNLPPEELREYREVVRNLFLRFAFKVPYHAATGFKEPQGANTVLHYVNEARSIAEGGLKTPETIGELYLARRAWKALKNSEKVAEIEEKIAQTEPVTIFDYSSLAKYHLLDKKDMATAQKMYQRGIDLGAHLRLQYLSGHREAQAHQTTIESIGIRLAYVNALKTSGDNLNAFGQLTACKVLADTLQNSETGNYFYSMALTQEAIIITRVTNASLKPGQSAPEEQIEHIRSLYHSAIERSPGPSSLITYLCWAEFERAQKNYDKAVSICNDALAMEPNVEPLLFERVLSESFAGQRDKVITTSCEIINLYLKASDKHLGVAQVNSFESIATMAKNNPEVFNSMEIVAAVRIAAALGISSQTTEDKELKERQLVLAFEIMEGLVNESAKQDGYGRNLIYLTPVLFEPLKTFSPERFDTLTKNRDNLPSNKPAIQAF